MSFGRCLERSLDITLVVVRSHTLTHSFGAEVPSCRYWMRRERWGTGLGGCGGSGPAPVF